MAKDEMGHLPIRRCMPRKRAGSNAEEPLELAASLAKGPREEYALECGAEFRYIGPPIWTRSPGLASTSEGRVERTMTPTTSIQRRLPQQFVMVRDGSAAVDLARVSGPVLAAQPAARADKRPRVLCSSARAYTSLCPGKVLGHVQVVGRRMQITAASVGSGERGDDIDVDCNTQE
ncbi:hypothetical protein HIM_08008 [Hirsutella minnesotensis 3608]|uniref:Uncharacterized protein n=1 Tax=Hirsutella minnesotensis 3608 TaxID=1043627 RepID=A0A0F8A3Y7_9HYPO|nr:hypothetical protein HIM_08008 [Hirsutella minnesotensis 3608]